MNEENKGEIVQGWSWAWSFATTYTLIVSRKYGLLFLYWISLMIPFINFISYIWFFIFGWLKWKEWIYENITLTSEEQKVWAIKTMGSLWFVLMIIFVISILTSFLFFGVIMTIIGWVMRGLGG